MTQSESNLCWKIIDCPMSCPIKCCSIVAVQAGKGRWQIPEPWNGSLRSEFLIVSENPALDEEELYPSTLSVSSSTWVAPGIWNPQVVPRPQVVEDFFEGRFGRSTNPAFPGKKYVDIATNPASILLRSGRIKAPKNPYWDVANKICGLLNPNFQPWSFAFTDVVHCKSSSGAGNPQFMTCRHHTKAIIDLFVETSEAEIPTVILLGSQAKKQKNFFFGSSCVSQNNSFGTYLFSRKGVQTKNIVDETYVLANGRKVRVISGIPAPSKSNCQVSNVKIGHTRLW